MQTMTAAEAVVASLVSHGIHTVYALPGVHNDHFFDAIFRTSNRVSVVHSRHEQGAAYMALGAALATGKPQAYSVVPGPGLLNSSAALLQAYSLNAPVLGLIGQIPEGDIGRGLGHLHEIRDQTGILERLVDFSARIRRPEQASRLTAQAFQAMASGRPGPAVLQCAIDMWGRSAAVEPQAPLKIQQPAIDQECIADAARKLGVARNPMILCGGGALDASPEVNRLSIMLQAPVLSFRRSRGVLDSRNPFSVPLPLAHELWRDTDVVLAVGTRMLTQLRDWGVDDRMTIIRVDANPEEPARLHKPSVALIGDAAPILRRLLDALPAQCVDRPSRKDEMVALQAKWRRRFENELAPQLAYLEAIRAELPEDGIFVDEVTQVGFVARLTFPTYRPRTYLAPGYQDNLGWGFATALGAQHARPEVPVVSINGDGGFMYTANELATAVRHEIAVTAVVFADGAFGNVRRIQQEQFGGRTIASDLANPDFVRYAESFGAAAERVHDAEQLRGALKRAFARRHGPTVIEVPVGAVPSPWQFLKLPKVRGK